MFSAMVERIKEDSLSKICRVQIRREETVQEMQKKQEQEYVLSRGDGPATPQTVKRKDVKVGRNDPCPCGSGRKYKKCCGK